jgi:hypothetical protein
LARLAETRSEHGLQKKEGDLLRAHEKLNSTGREGSGQFLQILKMNIKNYF